MVASQFGAIADNVPTMAQMRNLNDPSGDVLANDERLSNDINDTIGELERMGYQLSQTQIDGLRDPMTRQRVRNQLIAAGNPTKATESALNVWESRNKRQPYQFENAGDRIIGLDPLTGGQVSEFEKGASQDAILSSNTQRRGQDVSAATTRRGQTLTDGRAERTERTKLPSGFILNGN